LTDGEQRGAREDRCSWRGIGASDDGKALYGRPGKELVGGFAEQFVAEVAARKFDELG